MKKALLGLIAILLSSSLSFAQMKHHHDSSSVHGMLLMGKNKIYLSHLPMFHSPHDYQVILEVQLSESAQAKYLSHLNSSNETVYTLVPESFILPDMVKNPRPFAAQIYKGHFERGGQLIANQVTVQITKVVYFKKFNPQDTKPVEANYILFGNSDEQFLAHVIKTKPDFDQVVKIQVVPEAIETLSKEGSSLLVIKSQLNEKPLELSILQAEMINSEVSLNIQSLLYLETGDLSF